MSQIQSNPLSHAGPPKNEAPTHHSQPYEDPKPLSNQTGSDKKDSVPITALKHIKHQLILRFKPRRNKPYTQFYRFHHQYSVLSDKILPFLCGDGFQDRRQRIDIILFGASDGSEPYSLSSLLQIRHPNLDFHIRAFDIIPEMIEKAKSACYTHDDAYRNPFIEEDFIKRTFEIQGDDYLVRSDVSNKVEISEGDILDKQLIDSLPKADLVLAQNMLFHLPRSKSRIAFSNLVRLLKPRSSLFVNGMDTDIRIDLTQKLELDPVDYLVEEVHNDAFENLGGRWSSKYYGRAPFSTKDPNWLRKFGTVFVQNKAKASPDIDGRN